MEKDSQPFQTPKLFLNFFSKSKNSQHRMQNFPSFLHIYVGFRVSNRCARGLGRACAGSGAHLRRVRRCAVGPSRGGPRSSRTGPAEGTAGQARVGAALIWAVGAAAQPCGTGDTRAALRLSRQSASSRYGASRSRTRRARGTQRHTRPMRARRSHLGGTAAICPQEGFVGHTRLCARGVLRRRAGFLCGRSRSLCVKPLWCPVAPTA